MIYRFVPPRPPGTLLFHLNFVGVRDLLVVPHGTLKAGLLMEYYCYQDFRGWRLGLGPPLSPPLYETLTMYVTTPTTGVRV